MAERCTARVLPCYESKRLGIGQVSSTSRYSTHGKCNYYLAGSAVAYSNCIGTSLYLHEFDIGQVGHAPFANGRGLGWLGGSTTVRPLLRGVSPDLPFLSEVPNVLYRQLKASPSLNGQPRHILRPQVEAVHLERLPRPFLPRDRLAQLGIVRFGLVRPGLVSAGTSSSTQRPPERLEHRHTNYPAYLRTELPKKLFTAPSHP